MTRDWQWGRTRQKPRSTLIFLRRLPRELNSRLLVGSQQFEGTATSVNASGIIVGFASSQKYEKTTAGTYAFIYEKNAVTDLNDVIQSSNVGKGAPSGHGYWLGDALDMNDAGQIVGTAWNDQSWLPYVAIPIPVDNSGQKRIGVLSPSLPKRFQAPTLTAAQKARMAELRERVLRRPIAAKRSK